MNKTELLHLLEETVPPLRGKLHIERVLYQKAANKAYMSFLSDELVTEHDYLLLERRLRELFPKLTVALRIASPSLGEKFLADLNRYKPVLTDFLRRQSPALAAWIADTGWSLEDGRILLTCPDQIAMGFFRSHHLDEKLSQAIYDIFRVRTPVALTVCGEREAWVEKMRADRGFSFAGRRRRPCRACRSGPAHGTCRSPRNRAQKACRTQGRPCAQRSRRGRCARPDR